MKHYPIVLNIEGRRCLVVGGGRVALGKARSLASGGGRLFAVSPTFDPGFDELVGLERWPRPFEPEDLEGMFLAMAATDDPAVNRAVAAAGRARGVLCNVVDAPELCDFFVPSTLARGRLTIAVSTEGASPALAKRIRGELEDEFDIGYAEYLEFLMHARERMKGAVPSRRMRETFAGYLASRKGYERFVEASPAAREAWIVDLIERGQEGSAEP